MDTPVKKSFLFIFQQAPHESLNAKEGLDFALSCAAFDQKIDVLFTQDGVYQLIKNQSTESIHCKNHSSTIDALSLYGIENCFYQEACANKRNLEEQDLKADCQALNQAESSKLLQNYDFIFNYWFKVKKPT